MKNFALKILEQILFRALVLLKFKKKIVFANLQYAKISGNSEILYRKILKNLTRHFCEFLNGDCKKLPQEISSYPKTLGNFTYKIENEEIIKKMKCGGIFLIAHYGNYEAVGPWLVRLGVPLKASYAKIKPAFLNEILENKIRAVNNYSYSIFVKNPRDVLRSIKKGELFCLVADQDSRIKNAKNSRFFGHAVNSNPLPEFILKQYPETPVFICYQKENLHTKEKTLTAIEVPPSQKNNVMDFYNEWLERTIKTDVSLWYGWTHRRFFSTAKEIYR